MDPRRLLRNLAHAEALRQVKCSANFASIRICPSGRMMQATKKAYTAKMTSSDDLTNVAETGKSTAPQGMVGNVSAGDLAQWCWLEKRMQC